MVDARLGPAGRRPPCNLAFLDPPYGKGLGERALAALAEGRWLAPDAIIVAEESAGATIVWPAGYEVLDVRRWGDTQAAFARYKS
jgi:16S rRNA (guanine966-N2)-methyltransferase